MRRFDSPEQQTIYDLYAKKTGVPELGQLGSGGLTAAYQRGYWYPNRRSQYVRTSLAYAAWRAGKDHKLAEEKRLLAEHRGAAS